MGDIPLMPKGYILHDGLNVGANDAGQAADLLGDDRVALVRHSRRALLAFGEGFFGFPDFGALEMANFEGDLLERGGDEGQRGDPSGVAVAGENLASDGSRFKAEPGADSFLRFGTDMAEGADGAGNFADAQIFRGPLESRGIAAKLVVPQ